MRRLLLLFSIFLCLGFNSFSKPNGVNDDNNGLIFNSEDERDKTKGPRAPYICPLTGYYNSDEIFLLSSEEGVAEIYVYDSFDLLVYFGASELTYGYFICIDDIPVGGKIIVSLNDKDYTANI